MFILVICSGISFSNLAVLVRYVNMGVLLNLIAAERILYSGWFATVALRLLLHSATNGHVYVLGITNMPLWRKWNYAQCLLFIPK